MTEKIHIQFESGRLEGLFERSENNCGVIITHPHPEYGGSMYNGVVMALEKAYQDKGYTTLRFNFRGTGNSTGTYEKFDDLCDDVAAAQRFMIEHGVLHIALAGYSFGSWVNTHAERNIKGLSHQLLVSPPVSFMDFSKISELSCTSFVICGDSDEYAALQEIEKYLKTWNVTSFKLVEGCDHFYSGMLEELYNIVKSIVI